MLTGDIINAGFTSVFGVKGLLRGLATQLVFGVVLGIVGSFTPLGLPALIVTVVLAAITATGWNFLAVSNAVRGKVVDACEDALRDNRQQVEMCRNIESQVEQQLTKIVDAAHDATKADLATVENELKRAIDTKKRGAALVSREKNLLDTAKRQNEKILSAITDLAIDAAV